MNPIFTTVFVVFAVMVSVRAFRPESVSDLVESQIKTQELRLNRLTSSVVNLLDRVSVRPSMDMVKHELSKLRKEDKFCENNRIPCGRSPQCISPRFFCDDVIDCQNKFDESPARCANPMTKNSVWIGYPVMDVCTPLESTRAVFHIIEVIEDKFFKETVNLKMQMRLETTLFTKMEVILLANGTYSRGNRLFTMHPQQSDGLGSLGYFDGVSDDRFIGHIVHHATGNVCADFRFTRMTHQ